MRNAAGAAVSRAFLAGAANNVDTEAEGCDSRVRWEQVKAGAASGCDVVDGSREGEGGIARRCDETEAEP